MACHHSNNLQMKAEPPTKAALDFLTVSQTLRRVNKLTPYREQVQAGLSQRRKFKDVPSIDFKSSLRRRIGNVFGDPNQDL